MKKLLVMDEHNYSDGMEEIYRISVRGIIFVGGKLLMIEDAFGEVKLPGGGMEPGEEDSWNQREYRTLLLIRDFIRNIGK